MTVVLWLLRRHLHRAVVVLVSLFALPGPAVQAAAAAVQRATIPATNPEVTRVSVPNRAVRDRVVPFGGQPETQPSLICFPPNPPVLVADLTFARLVHPPSPIPEMAPYIGDYFYAPLSSRRIARKVSAKAENDLRAYTQLKSALVEELRTRTLELELADAAARLESWRALAEAQAARLAECERRAEELRVEFLRGALFGNSSSDWYARRRWRLGRGRLDRPRDENRFFEYQVLRAAAYYQHDLSLDVRGLLREVAIEMEAEVFATEETKSFGPDPFVFFSPNLSRVLPNEATAELFERFATEKSALKRELRDALYVADGAVFGSERNRVLTNFARDQAGRIAALEKLADEIRAVLAGDEARPYPPPVAPLPPELTLQIDGFLARKRVLEEKIDRHMQTVLRALPPSPDPDPESMAHHAWTERRESALHQAETEFYSQHATEISALRDEAARVNDAIEAAVGPQPQLGRGSQLGTFVLSFLAQRRQQASYREYYIACFEPGLVPAQRRLLFDAAMQTLELPLPAPEQQPEIMPGTVLK